jgi:hypothetical protein
MVKISTLDRIILYAVENIVEDCDVTGYVDEGYLYSSDIDC